MSTELKEGDVWRGAALSMDQGHKYHVRWDNARHRWNVAVDWPKGKRTFTETDAERLVAAVNRVALRFRGKCGGGFYYNDHQQVLKPTGDDGLRYVGEFPAQSFQFGPWRNVWPHVSGRNLSLGDDWSGPLCGSLYRLGGPRGEHPYSVYRRMVDDRRDYLSDHLEYPSYRRLAEAVYEAKNGCSGRFYVTEGGSVWVPAGDDPDYRYAGRLRDFVGGWFPKWQGPECSAERAIRGESSEGAAVPGEPSLSPDSFMSFRVRTRVHQGELSNPIELLNRFLRDGGMTMVGAAFEHSYFVAPERVRKKTPLYPKYARTSRKHYRKGVSGGRGKWKGRKVKLGDDAKAQAAWKKYSRRRLVQGSGYEVRHPWGNPWDPDAFTAGWNLCYMPFWAAKLLDEGSRHEGLWQAFRQASWDLYFRSDPVCEPPEFVKDPGLDLAEILQGQPLLILAD